MRNIKPARELYMAKSLNELKNLCDVNKEVKIERLSQTLTLVYKKAEDAMLEGDEEKAYVLFMRYFDLLVTNEKKPGYEKHRKFIADLLGGNSGVRNTLDKIEMLAKNLEIRYEQAYPTKMQTDDEMVDTPEQAAIDVQPSAIEADEFYKLLKSPSTSMLVIDCRPKEDYEQSRIKYRTMLNVPEELLVKGVSVGKIKDQLSDADGMNWAARTIKQKLILLDYQSCEFQPESPIWVLKDVLENWDNDFEGTASIQLVNGGYENFKLLYPMECENPNYEPKQKPSQVPMMNEIQYPDLDFYDELQPQASSLSAGPLVDRSKKLTAIKTYEDRKKQYEIINTRKEKNTVDALELEKELLKKEKQWQEIAGLTPENDMKLQELASDILQKENKIRELLEENERLKKNEKLVSEVISEKDKAFMEERNRRVQLEEKEKEYKKIEEQQKQLAKERQRIQAETRKVQRQQLPEWKDDEALPPQFDRNTKPMHIPERQRDFSPVGKAMVSTMGFEPMY